MEMESTVQGDSFPLRFDMVDFDTPLELEMQQTATFIHSISFRNI